MSAHYELQYNELTKLVCVSYVDKYSAGKQSMNDLLISYEQKIFAAGSKRLASYRPGDYVIICANDPRRRWAFLARITECLDETLDAWHDQGGNHWEYNFRIQPLTGVTEITPHSNSRITIDHYMEECGLGTNKLFNSRFCSNKLIRGLAHALLKGSFQSYQP